MEFAITAKLLVFRVFLQLNACLVKDNFSLIQLASRFAQMDFLVIHQRCNAKHATSLYARSASSFHLFAHLAVIL